MGLRDQWYKNVIIYCLDVQTYADSNGDGVGDFPGLTRRLDYIAGLGVNCLWLMPFYPSPNRDDGYDVADYSSVDPRYGSIADFTEFMVEARERGLHVIVDMVPNHSSDQHPWFQQARHDPHSPYRDYYVWREDDPGDTSDQVAFPGVQKSTWTWDVRAKAYYLHHFYDFQPDLNYANPAVRELRELPTIPMVGQWVNFLRHHDELNIGRLTKDQKEQVFAAFAPEPDMQLYDRGLRRRLAPMLGGDQAWLRGAYSTLFSLPGAPIIFYGEEIGMGENLALPERMSVRTPMQWTSYDHGGFSTAPPNRLVRPMNAGGAYGFERVSVAAQRADAGSLLNWLAALMRTRRECTEIGAGDCKPLDTGEDAILGLCHEVPDSTIICLNNLAPDRRTATLHLSEREVQTATDLFADRDYEPLAGKTQRIRMNGRGYRWIRVGGIY